MMKSNKRAARGKRPVRQSGVVSGSIVTSRETVIFSHLPGPYQGFSNFTLSPFRLEARVWRTVEHYFQAHKFEDENLTERIRRLKRPHDAFRVGNDRRLKLRRDWEDVKVQVMYEALWAKFTQHPRLATLLRSTGRATLIEHSAHDGYWGNACGRRGRNMLGRLLMKVREELNEHDG